MSKTKTISYIISTLILIVAVVVFSYPDFIFGPPSGIPALAPGSELGFNLMRMIFSVLLGVVGFVLLILTILQKESAGVTESTQQSLWFRQLNPIILLAIGVGIFLPVYFDIGFNYSGIKWLLLAASGLIFAFGLGGLLQELFKK